MTMSKVIIFDSLLYLSTIYHQIIVTNVQNQKIRFINIEAQIQYRQTDTTDIIMYKASTICRIIKKSKMQRQSYHPIRLKI